MSHNDPSNDNNKQTIWIVVGILILTSIVAAGLMMSSTPAEPQINDNQSNPSRLSAAESSYNFGTISMKDGNVSKTFTIENKTSEPVTITKIYTSCMCTTAELETNKENFGPFGMPGHGFLPRVDQTIKAKEKARIKVTYDPNAHGPAGIGKINRQIFIETSNGRKLTLQFNVNVTP